MKCSVLESKNIETLTPLKFLVKLKAAYIALRKSTNCSLVEADDLFPVT